MFGANETMNPGEYLVSDRPWRPEDSQRYAERGCDSVYLNFTRQTSSQISLNFLRDLPNLRRVAVTGALRDDTIVFELEDLCGLGLYTGCKKPLRLERSPGLDTLAVDDRPGVEKIRDLAGLINLTITRFKRSDLSFLGQQPKLEFLRVEGRHQPLSLEGIQGVPEIDELNLFDVSVSSLDPLYGLKNLREVQISPTPKVTPQEPWDLSVLASLPRIHWFIALGPVRSLAPLTAVPTLKRVSFGTVMDGDLEPLLRLPADVVVGPIDHLPHYSPTAREVELLRAR